MEGSRKWKPRDKIAAVYITATHLLALCSPFCFTWAAFRVAAVTGVFTSLFGINLSYHRHLTHRSFKIPKWLEYSFAYLGVHALQGDPIFWVSNHRFHHQYSDTGKDPHSPVMGFWYSHMRWIFNMGLVREKIGKRDNISDLENQAFYRWIRYTYFLHPMSLAILLYAIGGTSYVIYGMGLRVVLAYHATWLVNSAGHTWGTRIWKTNDLSRNNWWVAMMTFGEGWHNNHHAFNYSAKHGLEWWQIDITWYLIKSLESLGLAYDVKLPSQAQMHKLAIKEG